LDADYDSIGDYFKDISKPENKKKHSRFLATQKEWIADHNNPDLPLKLKNRQDLYRACYKKLEVVSEHGHSLEAPDMAFVELEHWDTKIDGEYAPEDVKTELVDNGNREVKGVWKMSGRAGVHTLKRFDKSSVVKTSLEEQGDSSFAHEAIDMKSKAPPPSQLYIYIYCCY